MAEQGMTKTKYWIVFAILMVLLVLTVLVAYLHVDPTLGIIIAMTIAVIKAVLVVLYFMHVRYNSKLTWVFVLSGFFWLVILIGITLTDYYSRDWEEHGYGAYPDQHSTPFDVPTDYKMEENKNSEGGTSDH